MRARRRKYKRRILGTVTAVSLIAAGLAFLLYSRLHFPHQISPTLARTQWNTFLETPFRGITPTVIGHRGSGIKSTQTGLLIGNTANAIQNAIDSGVDWIEIDIRVSSDSRLSLGYTALWSSSGNRFKVLFAPTKIIDQCQTLRCKYLVLPVIFASGSLVQSATSHRIQTWVYGTEDLRDIQHLAKNSVSGFIVDHPAAAINHFRAKGDGG